MKHNIRGSVQDEVFRPGGTGEVLGEAGKEDGIDPE